MAFKNVTVLTDRLAMRRNALVSLEKIVERNLKSFFEVGKALTRIRDEKLYVPEYTNFEDYCIRRWKFRRQHAYRLIDAADVVRILTPLGNNVWNVITSESQLRPLTVLERSAERRKAFRLALSWSQRFPPTARLVRAAVADVVKQKNAAFFQKDNNTVVSTNRHWEKRCQIVHADSRKPDIVPPQSADLIFGSPPYNIGIEYPTKRDDIPYQAYLNKVKSWLKAFAIWAKPTGRLAIVVGIDTHKFGPRPLAADWTRLALNVGWQYQSTILWNEGSTKLWPALNRRVLSPQIATPSECILIFSRGKWERQSHQISDLDPTKYQEWATGHWKIPGAHASEVGHPSPFPSELVQRVLKMLTFPGDAVVDPWMGSGTTLVECLSLKRYCIGIDVEKEYCTLAQHRLTKFIGTVDTKHPKCGREISTRIK